MKIPKIFYTIDDVHEMTGISVRHLQKLIAAKEIVSFKIHGRRRMRAEDVEEFIRRSAKP